MYVYTYICAHGRLVSETRQRERACQLVKQRAMYVQSCNHIRLDRPVEINKICVCVCVRVLLPTKSPYLLLSLPNKVWRPVAVTIQFGWAQARLDSR